MVALHGSHENHVLDAFEDEAEHGGVTSAIESRAGWTLLTAVSPMVWGTTYIVTTHLLPEGHPLFAAMMRALPAGLIALLIARRLPTGAWWWRSLVLGALNMGAFFPLLFVAAQHLPGGVAATLGATQPIIVAFLAVAILREKLSAWRVAWGVIGVVGVALVVLGPGAGLDSIGIIAGIAGAGSMGVGVVLTKKWGRPVGVSAIGLAGWQLTAGGAVLLIPALVIDGIPDRIDAPAVVGYAWLTLIGALVTYSIWFSGIQRLPIAPTALLGLLSPLVAAILGAALAGEAMTPVQIAGFVVAFTAVVAGQLSPRAMCPKVSAPPPLPIVTCSPSEQDAETDRRGEEEDPAEGRVAGDARDRLSTLKPLDQEGGAGEQGDPAAEHLRHLPARTTVTDRGDQLRDA